jgi:hypothetical protein
MSTPRFTDEHLIPLRRVMLARQPSFVYTPADVEALVQETGLLKAQIQKWANNFRDGLKCTSIDKALDRLRGVEQVT